MSYKYRHYNSDSSKTSESRNYGNYSLKHGNRYSRKKSKKPLFIILLTSVLVIGGTLIVTGLHNTQNTFNETPTEKVKTVSAEKKEEKPVKISYKTTSDTTDIPKSNKAKYAVIVDKSDNTIVAERKSHKRTYPASTTKIMTLLVAVENIKDMDDTFTMTFEITDPLFIAEASVAGFKDGEKITMKDLLYGTILPSGADAAIGLAINVAGSEEEFVKLMNQKVEELGLENTHFANVTGLHDKENYSSAYDMAIILDAALQNEICKEVLSTYQHTTAKTKQNPDGILLSSTLFNYMYGTEPETATILGGKTGYVTEAGYCIASYGEANENGNEYIVVTFDNPGLWPAFYGQIDLYKEFAK